ncbi:transposase domain-containing protein [Pseudoduganella sp. R-34]|uniref:transposase domain-containing protein n=1 Tax=unclassified Pseudoduganella TaxID=2637179 RepID=UPI003CEF84B2
MAYYRRIWFGKKSEALTGEQRELFEETVDADLAELSNGSAATVTRDFMVQVLGGSDCGTPTGLNPYVCYLNDTSAMTVQVDVSATATPLAPIVAGASIVIPGVQVQADVSELSMEAWLQQLSQSLAGSCWRRWRSCPVRKADRLLTPGSPQAVRLAGCRDWDKIIACWKFVGRCEEKSEAKSE